LPVSICDHRVPCCARSAKRDSMPKVKIEIFEGGAPSATINVPIWLLTDATGLLSSLAGGRLKDSVDSGQIEQLLKTAPAGGRVLEVEDHGSNERIVISIVGDTEPRCN